MENTSNEEIIVEQKPKSNKLTGSSTALLATHGFNYVISIFVSTFLISYIYSISSNYVLNIGLFYCFNYLSMGVFCYFVSKILDKTNRVSCYRIAIVIRALFIVAVIFLGEKFAKVTVLAGILHGFSEAIYWSSFNLMKNELVPNRCMKKYTTLQIIENKGINFVIPIILGKFIDVESFKSAAIIVFVMAVVQIVISLFIKSHRPENSGFDLKSFFERVKQDEKHKTLFKVFFVSTIFFGLTTLVSPINTIIIMLTFNSNFSLGVLTGVFSAISIVLLMLAKKFFKPGKSMVMYGLLSVLIVAITIVITIITNKAWIIVFNLIYITCATFNTYYYDYYRNILLKKLDMYDDIAEYQCVLELIMQFSRAIGFALMILTGVIGACFGVNGLIVALKIYLCVAILVYVALNFCFYLYEKKLIKYEIL